MPQPLATPLAKNVGSFDEIICSYDFKDRQMGHYAMVSLLCESLLTNTKFRILHFRVTNCYAHLMLNHLEKELPNDSGRPLSYYNFTDKTKIKKQKTKTKTKGCC